MFKVIAVDDEQNALNRFERLISQDNRLELLKSFTKASDAIEFAKTNTVDIAFLDIEMPEMTGLELAEILMDSNPYLEVVFVTAYNQYALDAFRAHATGYLLKPLSTEDFSKQIDNMEKKLNKTPQVADDRLVITCFGSFSIRKGSDNEPLRFRTSKAEELLAYLVQNEGRARVKDSILDTLWPDADLDKAANNFRVTCTYIRSTLVDFGYTDVLVRDHDDYSINTARINCDYIDFRNKFASPDTLSLADIEYLIGLYKGPYLENRFYDWAEETKGWLESRYIQLLYRAGELYTENGRIDAAIDSYEAILRVDLYEEEAFRRIIKLTQKKLPPAAIRDYYTKYSESLNKEYGLDPSHDIKEMMRAILA
jgi:two-component SAPR family response regulator